MPERHQNDRQQTVRARASNRRPVRLAFVGMRGLPADLPKAGGGERETEAKATRLAARGHDVLVYCRWHYNRTPASPYRGVRLVSLPSVFTKHLDTVSHTFLAVLHACLTNAADIINFHGMGNALFVPLARLAGKRCVVYMDGIDWERPKWGRTARLALRLGARLAFDCANAVYVDNTVSQNLFRQSMGREPHVITLGADVWPEPGADLLQEFGVEPGRYLLFVGLLKPDKGVHLLVEAYERLKTPLPLVIVGGSPDRDHYVETLKKTRDQRIRFCGYVYGKRVQQLYANAALYIQPSLMEGNSPSLMTAMACGRCVVASDIPQNIETVGSAGLHFRSGDAQSLQDVLARILDDEPRRLALGAAARRRIETVYSWDAVVEQLERMYLSL